MSTPPSAEIIYPCPLSKNYSIPAKQAWALLSVFLAYRLVLSGLFTLVYYNQWTVAIMGINNAPLFFYSCHAYLLFSGLSSLCVLMRWTNYPFQAQLLILSDIFILTLLMHACGGVNSGVGALLGVSIASGGLLIGGRCAIFFAALASLAVLAEQYFANLAGITHTSAYSYAGMLGASFFTIALLSYVLAKRSEQTLQLAHQQKDTIVKLEELNHYIIQNLQSGIIIISRNQRVQMANDAALRLLDLTVVPVNLNAISGQLVQAFEQWLRQPEDEGIMLSRPNNVEIHGRFIALPTLQECFYMVVIEDIALYQQRVQQSKLVSLGRLTASIAHEIRNPLCAISHAGQLLAESLYLPPQDARLTKIIQTNCNRVNHIIEDILQLSRRADSRQEKIYVVAWLQHFLQSFTQAQGVSIETFRIVAQDNFLCASIDPSHLKQIMDNLCQNALRYGKPELGAITVNVLKHRFAPCIDVIDNGDGINHSQLNTLFEPFMTTSVSGVGLGLYISKELAELNQAKLSYHLTAENRTCFRLCLQDANQKLIEI